jgi:hypothetical protein
VGSAGVILKWQGASWTPAESGTANALNGILALRTGCGCRLFVVGSGGTILHR